MKYFGRAAVRLTVIVITFGISLLLLEAVLAMTQFNTKSTDLYVADLGLARRIPNAYYRHTGEGFSEGYFNSHGFRDYERSYTKPEGVFRILVLGDSYVEALQVPLEKSFPALLEKRLNKDSGTTKFEVLNLGQSGFGTDEEYLRYTHFGVKFHPDLVILAFLTGNDFQDNSKFLSRESVRFYYELDGNGNLVQDRSVVDQYKATQTLPKRAFKWVKERSYLASLVSERLFLLAYQMREKRFEKLVTVEAKGDAPGKLSAFSHLNIYFDGANDHWKEAFDVTDALLTRFARTVEANGSRFVLVTLSNAEQMDPEVQRVLQKENGVRLDFDSPDRRIEELAKRINTPYLKLMPTFRDYFVRTGTKLHGFFGERQVGHWNETGHRLAAEKTFEFLKETQLLYRGETGTRNGG